MVLNICAVKNIIDLFSRYHLETIGGRKDGRTQFPKDITLYLVTLCRGIKKAYDGSCTSKIYHFDASNRLHWFACIVTDIYTIMILVRPFHFTTPPSTLPTPPKRIFLQLSTNDNHAFNSDERKGAYFVCTL